MTRGRWLGLVLAAAAAGGCGLKGPLYLPEKSEVVIRPAPATPEAPAAPETPAAPATGDAADTAPGPAAEPAPPPPDETTGPGRGG